MADKKLLLDILAATPAVGLAIVLILVLLSRSKDGAIVGGPTAHIRRWTLVRWLVVAIVFAVATFFIVQRDHFAPSWTFTAWITCGAFLAGEAFGRWSVERRIAVDDEAP